MMKRRILIPMKNALQEKADEYADRQDVRTLQNMKRIECLDENYILFVYANFSITCIRQFADGTFGIDDYFNQKFTADGDEKNTVSQSLREKWHWEGVARNAEKPMTYAKHDKVIEMAKNMSYNW